MQLKKALVIGSEGNIGKPLVKYLKTCGYNVLRVDHKPNFEEDYMMADIRNISDMLPAFDWKPDVVFHLAAMVSRVTCEQASSLAIDVNLTGTQNVLDLTKRVNAHLVYFSTSEVYGPNIDVMSEDILPCPNNRYGLSKLLSESLVEYEVKQHGLSAVILRPFMMYDEEEDLGDHRSAMIRFATNLVSQKPIQVHKGSIRGWLHVSDAVRAIEAAANVKKYSVINIGNPDIRPIEELVEMVRVACGASKDLIEIIELPTRMTLVKNPTLDKQTNLLGVTPQVNLEQGIKLVCDRIKQRISKP
ncbi:MAG: NAD(P)-dependent oxidoreductase [Rickettsia endosymbiont of Bryobia graminum]|nr:NAD(P)-dependent oxidoreductase [Rickettsia endosymbiont of Bryobia graminum]